MQPSSPDMASAADVLALPSDAVITVDPAAAEQVKFVDFGLHPDILRAVLGMGYETPTPIQAKAIPVVMSGRDVMGAAQTGTGKTAGFALPILQLLMPLATPSPSPARHPVRALVLAPTRELADQIYVNFREYAKFTPLRVTCVYGGVDIKPQLAEVRKGVEILIATPGRLLDHIEQKTVRLDQASILVLDEADRMLDMGFLPDISRILNLLPKQRQSLMFSATFSEEIKKLSQRFLTNPLLIEVARRNQTNDNVAQRVYKVDSTDGKRQAVAQLVRDLKLEQVIVFSNTKIGCGRLARQLEKEGLNASAIHGDKSQQERQLTLDAFKAGAIKILVATDVAARGLDIAELPAVINFDIPHSPEDYVHRIGRTGRAGASGIAITLVSPGDERYLQDIEKLIKKQLPSESLKLDAVDVVPAARRERSERSERAAPAERAERTARPERTERGERSRYSSAASRLPGTSADPFFSQPYVEKAEPGSVEDANAVSTAGAPSVGLRAGLRRSRVVAALLGGLGRKGSSS
jgi:ATP-dependent RNA helicase RhlE